jgi:hypothetical protein
MRDVMKLAKFSNDSRKNFGRRTTSFLNPRANSNKAKPVFLRRRSAQKRRLKLPKISSSRRRKPMLKDRRSSNLISNNAERTLLNSRVNSRLRRRNFALRLNSLRSRELMRSMRWMRRNKN